MAVGQKSQMNPGGLSFYDDSETDYMWKDAPHPALMSPLKGYGEFNHFHRFAEDQWTTTVVSAGTGTSTVALTDAARGILAITTAADENDGGQTQTDAEIVTLTTSNRVWFDCYVKIGDEATQSDAFVGLATLDSSLIASAPTNKVGFRKDDGDTQWDFVCKAAATTNVSTAVTTGYVLLGFKWNGSTVTPYINGIANSDAAVAAASASTDVEMAISFAYLNGAGVAQGDEFLIDFYRLVVVDS